MLITKEFLDKVGRNSPIARAAMVQAGDKGRIRALMKFLISVGSCEITLAEARALGLPIQEKKYCFMSDSITYVLLDGSTFERYKPLTNAVDLQVAHIRNGIIGIRRGDEESSDSVK
ncbi:MAG: hypothetical protein LBQ58_03945 [Synergistaceae bacterium]|jgi:hypothetical protein|nr:hypothetical protein [Synergistaceae bacterium]